MSTAAKQPAARTVSADSASGPLAASCRNSATSLACTTWSTEQSSSRAFLTPAVAARMPSSSATAVLCSSARRACLARRESSCCCSATNAAWLLRWSTRNGWRESVLQAAKSAAVCRGQSSALGTRASCTTLFRVRMASRTAAKDAEWIHPRVRANRVLSKSGSAAKGGGVSCCVPSSTASQV